MTFERDLKNNYDLENIHKNAVNNIDKLSLLHGILNPSKRIKNNYHYHFILHVCMYEYT